MFKAYSVGLQEKDFELIRKITNIVTEENVLTKDLRYYDIKLEDTKDNILFIFGEKASRLTKDIKAKQIIYLPEISTLHAGTGIQDNRQETLEKLSLLKEVLEADSIKSNAESVLKDPVPDLKMSDLKNLESTLKEKEVNNWLTTTTSGKTVRISITPEITEADIDITFCELYALKIAMDALDIKEFTIIYNNKATKRSPQEPVT